MGDAGRIEDDPFSRKSLELERKFKLSPNGIWQSEILEPTVLLVP